MLIKDKVLEVLTDLPDTFSIDDLVERLIVLDKIEKGLQEVKEGKVVDHKEVKEKLGRWLK